MKMKKLLALLLTLVMVLGVVPTMALPALATENAVTAIKYKIGDGEEQSCTSFNLIGSAAYSATAQNQDVFLVNLPAGARITGYDLVWEGSSSSTVSILGANTSSTNLNNYTDNDYITGAAFGGEGLDDAQWYKKNFIGYLKADAKDLVLNSIPKDGTTGFAMRINIKDADNSTFASPVIVIQFENQLAGIK